MATVTDKDLGWKRILKETQKLKKSYTAVGFFGNGGSPGTDIAARAAVNEYGATIRVTKKMRGFFAAKFGIGLKKSTNVIRIPARPSMAKTYSLHKRKIVERQAIEWGKLIDGKQTARRSLARLGEWYVGRIKWVIKTVRFAPNSSLTVKTKGSSKPLIQSGEMRNSVTHREEIR